MDNKIITVGSYIPSAALTIGGLAINEWVAVTGIVLAIATFIVNWVYKHKHLEIERNRDEKG